MFLVLVTSNIAIITTMYLFITASLESGYEGYINDIELHQLKRVSTRLGELFQTRNGFTFLQHDQHQVRNLEELLFDQDILFPGYLDEEIEDAEEMEEFPDIPAFFVLDHKKNTIIGLWNKEDEFPLVPIQIDGKTVGWTGFSDMEEIVEGDVFIEAQNQEYLIITAITLLCSALFALGTAYHFEKPVKALAKGTRKLTSGRFDTRVKVQSNDEIGDLTRDFNILADKLEESEQARRKWVEDISHELKTPLTLLAGEIEAVRDGIRPLTDETVTLLGKDIEHLTELVNDLNDLWQTETEALSFCKTETRFQPVIQHCLEKFSKKFAAKNITVDFQSDHSDELVLHGDQKRLIQLYDNIFQNSLRYTDPGGTLQFRISNENDAVITTIQDTKPGVSQADLPHLFERLFRAEPSRNREFGGAGIGLALCKNIVLAHDGLIHAYTSPLGGLGLKIELPLADNQKDTKNEAADTRC